ncbi:MAG: hypothetical protein A4E53_03515 [Pelotomaculum sp. PtaB.Bin104]|nr:MAG: hypothetical protein A4E53_03515 [Pelotomaculum sp. PtaB.Bin104]
MAKVLRMSFKNEGGNTVSISLDAPRDNLTEAEVQAAMDLVISKNIFTSTGGNLVSKFDAKIIDTTVTDLYTPAV